ncbi:RagB/SusD family nutrient uptake outer membrane protein [Parapedobacter tibetensis]|uniref:RagB/SusD family nutrient uptake outer membrane protein n=1 Tax=Parapedobacter tibetensis TaxID=2972951 RepID=UPI00214DC984|nr:RagB/SusD family nutrient uptake outer membrane protein [Parapedobacter tibetensis]
MKNLLYSLLCVSALVSCTVDRISETELSDGSFWKSENDIRAAANYLYTFLPRLPVVTDNWSDDGYAVQTNNISDGSRLAPAASADFTSPYRLIRAASNLMDKSSLAVQAGVPSNIVDSYVAEAHFFRVWAYFDLVKRFGDVPLILGLLQEDSPELLGPRTPKGQVYEAMYNDLDAAIENLPTPSERGDAGYGRVTHTAALALKARIALFAGTWSKFHQDGDAALHLNLAVDAARYVMESGEHTLFATYFDLFQFNGEGPQNKENILVRQYGKEISDNIVSYNCGTIINGATNATKALVDAYLMKDGLPIDLSPLYTTPATFSETFVNRDERLNATVMKQGDPYFYGVDFQAPALVFHTTAYCPRKFVDAFTVGTGVTFIDYPIIRYAEVLLTYAEALYELNQSITDADLDISINLLRARAGLPRLDNAFVLSHGLDMREEIRRERRTELAMEGFRYWDLIRWKTAETELPKDVLGSYFFKDEPGFLNANPKLDPNNYILLQSAQNRRFDPAKDYVWPLPVNELAFNPQLTQNPGW